MDTRESHTQESQQEHLLRTAIESATRGERVMNVTVNIYCNSYSYRADGGGATVNAR